MASNKVYTVKFVAGNPKLFNKVRTLQNSPVTKATALEFYNKFTKNG